MNSNCYCTKKELAAETLICKKTVTRTLKAIGLDTAKVVYSPTEVQQFLLARYLVSHKKKTLKEVADYFHHYKTLKTINNEQSS